MAAIYLVRHGQAGFGKLNYDQLSDLGKQQGELVGQALHARRTEARQVVCGAMRRHRETMQAAQQHWHSWGPVTEMAGFNEFDSDEVIARAHPQFSNKLALGAWLMTQDNRARAFQTLFSGAVNRWISGEYDGDYQESWPAFTARIESALAQVIHQSSGGDIVIFTSGGPVTAIARQCLGLSNAHAFELNWTLFNGGITQLLYNRSGKVSLAAVNEHQHLAAAGKQFLTYR
ncbi:histidine phosphatase family protein [uncultured Thalassolituus sp.]|uniref:histidine phosphatase family protein n=1 Tax=uncultured Thalassolituus sp. TaxID=285273 RepID=UPI002621D37C|nr:histidine phosphatase family protein [uncultured Thalassolituus sp.]